MTESSREARIDKVIADYLAAVDQGQTPDQKSVLACHPEFAEELQAFFHDQEQLGRFAGALSPAPPPVSEVTLDDGSRSHKKAEALAPTEPNLDGPAILEKVHYFGDYEILEEIARGGMGVVYKARQISLKRDVAIKMILSGQLASQHDVHRFYIEAEAAANLDHPNIVPIYEINEHKGQHYFSMKLISGGSLTGRIKDMVIDPKAGGRLLATVARAVHHAHQRSILHRDLKPSNILLDAQGQPLVTDFGLAKRTTDNGSVIQPGTMAGSPDMTHAGAIVGTPSYMAPEQAAAQKDLTTAVDIYSLGAILYEMLTGRPPFQAATALDTLKQVLEAKPERPSKVNPKIDKDLEAICLKCLEKVPQQRYTSALALAEDLECWLAGKPIAARPSGPVKKVVKWVKRNPTLALLLAVLVCWFFNVRLPWRWEWLSWAPFAVLMLMGFWRLAARAYRVIKRLPGLPLDLTLDVFLVPGAVAALFILGSYPGDLDERKSLAFAIFFSSILWGNIFQWLWRRTRGAGPLLFALRPPVAAIICVAICCAAIIVGHIGSALGSEKSEDLFVSFFSLLQSLGVAIFFFLFFAIGFQIRKQGCLTMSRFVHWEEIESYEIYRFQNKPWWFLRLKLYKAPQVIQTQIKPAQMEIVDRIFKEHLPQARAKNTDQIMEDAKKSVAGENAATKLAAQIGDAAALLLLSGIIQILMALPFIIGMGLSMARDSQPSFESSWDMSRDTGMVVLILVATSATVGLLVAACALRMRMRRLQNYHLACLTSVLAMLPLGAGFLIGLPTGIWALRILSRPDVKESFAANAGPQQ
jgi:Protein kinase domain